MKYVKIEDKKLTVPTIKDLKKGILALYRSDYKIEILEYLKYFIKMKSIPTYIVNLATQLTEDQMRSLQLELGESRTTTDYQRIEEILTDYGLNTGSLSPKQIQGFAKFVQSY